jgi:hypothetical protein
MRNIIVLGLVLMFSAQAFAQPDPCLCNCPEPPPLVEVESPALREARHELWAIIGTSIAFFLVGEALTVGYVASNQQADRVLAMLPIAGPITITAKDKLSGEWASAMVFAAWLQAASTITAAVAGHALGELKTMPTISLRPGGATFDLITRF